MAARRRLLDRLKNSLAFIITVVGGILLGCLYPTAEAVEDKLKARHLATKHIDDHR